MNTVVINNDSNYYRRYDIVKYSLEGDVKVFSNYTYGNVELQTGESIRISNKSVPEIKFWLPNELVGGEVEVKEVADETLYVFTIEKDKNYEIRNIGNKNLEISDGYDSGNRYDIVKYKSNGEYKVYTNYYGDIDLEGN